MGMRNDAPSLRGGVTEPNESDEFQRRRELRERQAQIAIKAIDVLIALALAAIAAIVLKMIFY